MSGKFQIPNVKLQILSLIRVFYYSLFIVTPLLMSSQTSEMFEFNKMMYIYLITVLSFSLWCIHYIVKRPQLYLPKLVLSALLLLLSAVSVSTFQSIDPHTSFFGYYGRWNGGLLSIISFCILLFVFIQVFTKQYIHRLLKISLGTSTIVIFWGLLAKYGLDLSCYVFVRQFANTCWTSQFQPSVRMFSTLGQPNWLGAYLSIHFFIALYYFFNSYPLLKDHDSIVDKVRHILEKFHFSKESHPFGAHLFYVGYLVINFIAIYFTRSRSSLLSVGLMLVVGGILIVTKNLRKAKRSLIRFVVIVLLLIVTLFIVNIQTFLSDTNASPHLQITDSFEIRKIVWNGAMKLGKQYPLFGTGPETFAYSYYFTKPAAHNLTSEWDFVYNKAHNEYLNALATTGFIGLASYLFFIGAVLYTITVYSRRYQSNRLLVTILSLGYGTILITNFFGFSTSSIQLFFFLIPGIVLVLDQKEESDLAVVDLFHATISKKLLLTAVIVLTFFSLAYLSRYYRADRLYKQAKDQAFQNEYQKSVLLLMSALKLRYEHVYEDQLAASLAHLAFISSFESDRSTALKLIALSKDANAHTLRDVPKNIQYWKTEAKNRYLYYQVTHDLSDLKHAVASMKQVTRIAPTDANSYYMLGLFESIVYQESGDRQLHDQAIIHLNRSIKLRPQYIEAQELLDSLQNEP